MGGGLYDPLSAGVPAAARWRPSIAIATVGIVVTALVIFGTVVAIRGGGERGEPHAVVTIDRSPPVASSPTPSVTPSSPPAQTAPVQAQPPAASIPTNPASAREADVEIENGVRIVRMRPPESSRPTGQMLTVPPTPTALPKVTPGLPPSGAP